MDLLSELDDLCDDFSDIELAIVSKLMLSLKKLAEKNEILKQKRRKRKFLNMLSLFLFIDIYKWMFFFSSSLMDQASQYRTQ